MLIVLCHLHVVAVYFCVTLATVAPIMVLRQHRTKTTTPNRQDSNIVLKIQAVTNTLHILYIDNSVISSNTGIAHKTIPTSS